MILVDPKIMDSMRESTMSSPVPDATVGSLRQLDEQMRDILDRNDMNLEDKANLYQQVLRKYLVRVKQYENKPLGAVTVKGENQSTLPLRAEGDLNTADPTQGYIETDVLQSVPKTMKNKAERLLQRIRNHPDLKWNQRGEIVWKDQLITNSNLVDLIHDVLRKRRRHPDPSGWRVFSEALAAVNVPRELVGNPDRWKFIRTEIPATLDKSLQSTDSSSTPKLRNVALSSIQKLSKQREKETAEAGAREDTPLSWKSKAVKRKRKEQRLRKIVSLRDWQTI